MKKKLVFTAILIQCFIIPVIPTFGEDVLRPYGRGGSSALQPPLTIGVEGCLNFNNASQDLNWMPDMERSPQSALASGTGTSPYFGLFIDLPFSSRFGLEIKAGYDQKTFDNSSSTRMDYDVLNDRLMISNNIATTIEGNMTIKSDVRYSYRTDLSFVSIAALCYYEPVTRLKLFAGPILQIPAGKAETKKTYAVYNSYFTGGSKTVSVTDSYTIHFNAGIYLAVSYDFALSSQLTLSPIAAYQYMLRDYMPPQVEFDPPKGIGADATVGISIDKPRLSSLQLGLRLGLKL